MLKATARALAGKRFEPIDPDALLRLGPLGLRATGQRLADGGELVVEARPVIAPVDERLFCASCGAAGRHGGALTGPRPGLREGHSSAGEGPQDRLPALPPGLEGRHQLGGRAPGHPDALGRRLGAGGGRPGQYGRLAGRGAPGGLVGRRQRRRPESRHKGPGAPGGPPDGGWRDRDRRACVAPPQRRALRDGHHRPDARARRRRAGTPGRHDSRPIQEGPGLLAGRPAPPPGASRSRSWR